MNARQHAANFLLSIDPRYSIRKIGKAIFEAADTDEEFSKMLDQIQHKMGDGRSLITEEQFQCFERIKCRKSIPNIPTAPEWLRPVIAACYLKAKSSLASKKTDGLKSDLKPALYKVLEWSDKLEPDFIGELLIETTLAARDDAEFAKALNIGAAEFRSLVSELYGDNPPDDKSVKFAAAPSSSRGSCSACRGSHCEPISCWVVVVIVIIIIIVTK